MAMTGCKRLAMRRQDSMYWHCNAMTPDDNDFPKKGRRWHVFQRSISPSSGLRFRRDLLGFIHRPSMNDGG
ncbi:hypothetical protein PanWU01x14_159200 [Parasponia andersonii]|uniref:Uncharacterized protein n=1 Tax=Parasponia andersonii TaxID=3476 RepID=A0A2P5CEC1_PARAD|nr:hypothetical protein PanWU01x14_159200 [Parasponia andersonii]